MEEVDVCGVKTFVYCLSYRFDYLKSACFDRDKHVLYVLTPADFKVIANFTYIGRFLSGDIKKMTPS